MVKRGVIAVINYKGLILLGKKKKDSPKCLAGEWHMPSETTEEGESDEAALRRGLKEETGLVNIVIGKKIATDITPTNKRMVRWYECFAATDHVTTGSDLEDIKWVPRSEVPDYCSTKIKRLWPQEIQDYFKMPH